MSAADQQGSSAFLVTAPTPLGGRRFALAIVLASFVGFCALAPFARVPLPRIEAFIPIYESTLALIDLLTATLLFLAFSRSRLRAVLSGERVPLHLTHGGPAHANFPRPIFEQRSARCRPSDHRMALYVLALAGAAATIFLSRNIWQR